MNKNYYKVLGVSENVTDSEIKKAYFAKAKMYHPDVCKDKDADKKFKEVSMAYEALKDADSRKRYNTHINDHPNDNYNDSATQSNDYSNVNYDFLHKMFASVAQDDKFYVDFIKLHFKTEKEVISAYSYFWLSFWGGGRGCIDMLTNKNASRIFKAFCVNEHIKSLKESLTREVSLDKSKIAGINKLKDSIKKMNNSIRDEHINSQATYNWMFKIINEDNVFDDENDMYYFLLMSNDILLLLEKFEKIFVNGSSIKAKGHYSNNKKARTSGSLLSTVMIIVGIILLIRWLFW